MPPKSAAKESPSSTSKPRRSRRLAYRIKSLVKSQSASSKEQPSSSKDQPSSSKEQPPSSKEQPSSSNEQPSSSKEQTSTKENGKLPYRKKSVAKRQPASSNEGQSASTKKPRVKKRRIMKVEKLNKRASKMGIKMQDFSIAIRSIMGELSPDLKISEKAIANMNICLSHVFERLAISAGVFLLETNSDAMTVNDIETAVNSVIGGKLGKYCIAEGRRAVKKWNEE